MPIIHQSLEVLKPKLLKYEPYKIQKRIGFNKTIVFAVKQLPYDPSIPTLKEKHLLRKSTKRDHRSTELEAPVQEVKRVREKNRIDDEDYERENPIQTVNLTEDDLLDGPNLSEDDDIIPVEVPIRVENLIETEKPIEQEKPDEQEVLIELEEPSEKDLVEEQNFVEADPPGDLDEEDLTEENSRDRIVITGPEEDEFRQYDDEEEEESVISKNLKKIRSDPPANVLKEKPRQDRPTNKPTQQRRPPPPQHQPVLQPPPQQQKQLPPPREVTVDDINKLLDQKNLRLVHAELQEKKDIFKLDEAARLILKKAVFSCLERDEIFILSNLIALVFEFNYLSDTKFWDELIGKLRRKDNPHAKCHSFKCLTNPAIVLRNYQMTIQRIVEYFDSTNPTLTLPWHTNRYLIEASQRHSKPNGLTVPVITTQGVTNQQVKTIEAKPMYVAQENLDPHEERRDVTYFKDTDGQQKFKIKVPKREAKFNPKLLIT